MNRRTFERTDITSDVVLEHNSEKIPCQSINLSGNGACFLIDKSYIKDISEWKHGMELKFEFKTEEDEKSGIIPHYTCTIMHIEEVDDKYKIGASVAEDVLL